MNLTGDGLEIRLMRFPLRHEADYIAVRRGAALILLGEKWLLHSVHRVSRLPMRLERHRRTKTPSFTVISLPTPRGVGRFRESD